MGTWTMSRSLRRCGYVLLVGGPFLLASPVRADQPTAPLRESDVGAVLDTAELSATEDAWVSSARAGDNFGGDNRLYIGERPGYGAARSLVQFRMGDLDKARAVTAAEFVLENTTGGPTGDPARDVPIFRVDDSWDEGGVKWNNFPGTNGDRLATVSVGVGSGVHRWRSDKVTDLVQRWRLPKWQKRYLPNRGLFIQGYETGGSHRGFGSSESGQKPKLRLTHERDEKAPIGRLKAVPRYFNAKTADGATGQSKIKLSWDFEDPAPASGVAFFRLYSQRNNQPLVLEADSIEADQFEFRGDNGVEYALVINAVDQAGNVEPQEPAEALTLVDHQAPQVAAQPLPPFSRGTFNVVIGGGDLPNGPGQVNAGILWYDIVYRLNGGAWAPLVLQATSTAVAVTDPIDGATYDFHVRAFDKAENEQPLNLGVVQATTTIDRRPPVVTFTPVHGISNPRFSVQWAGVDPLPGASGVARYDIQFRIGGGVWTDWVTASTETSRVFEGAFSNVYSFRGRASDNVGNQGVYPNEAQLYVGVLDRATLTHQIRLPLVWR
ncbi:MAG: DNRLRE domain-containing protein [Ardenticatenales bacterium]|nr:DNRLRE domain-containing protein [Ardenticatenales bacterium]